MIVKPASPEFVLRHPDTGQPLPPEGGELPDAYALRRLRDGSAIKPLEPRANEQPAAPEQKQKRASRKHDEAPEAD